jgi:ABC-type dipeptide/oligopeptide/nickel transport system permease component
VQALVLMYALMFVTVNLLTDLLYTKVDPRVKL